MKNVTFFGSSNLYTFHGMTVICLSVKYIVCQFFWGPVIYYHVSHDMSVVANDCLKSTPYQTA